MFGVFYEKALQAAFAWREDSEDYLKKMLSQYPDDVDERALWTIRKISVDYKG